MVIAVSVALMTVAAVVLAVDWLPALRRAQRRYARHGRHT